MNTISKFTLLLIIGMNSVTFGQIMKSNVLIGGTLNFSSNNSGNSKTTSFSIDPSVSYFLGKKFTAGIICLTDYYQSTSGSFKVEYNGFSVGPTFRYYFPMSEKWALFPQVDYTYGEGTKRDERTAPILTTTDVGPTFRSGLGLTYFVSGNVGIEGLFYYQVTGHLSGNTGSIGARFGVQVYLSKKKTATL